MPLKLGLNRPKSKETVTLLKIKKIPCNLHCQFQAYKVSSATAEFIIGHWVYFKGHTTTQWFGD